MHIFLVTPSQTGTQSLYFLYYQKVIFYFKCFLMSHPLHFMGYHCPLFLQTKSYNAV